MDDKGDKDVAHDENAHERRNFVKRVQCISDNTTLLWTVKSVV